MSKGMTTCKVCGRDFALMAEDHYVVRDAEKMGVLPALSGQKESNRYDAFDCPHCGCQNVMQMRKIDVDADAEEPDGCVDCEYEDRAEDEEPCEECKRNYTDEYKKKGDK